MFYHQEDRDLATKTYELLVETEACDQSNKALLCDQMQDLSNDVRELSNIVSGLNKVILETIHTINFSIQQVKVEDKHMKTANKPRNKS